MLQNSFELKMRMVAFWKIVLLTRLIHTIALHLQLIINNSVDRELEKEISVGLVSSSGGIESLVAGTCNSCCQAWQA